MAEMVGVGCEKGVGLLDLVLMYSISHHDSRFLRSFRILHASSSPWKAVWHLINRMRSFAQA